MSFYKVYNDRQNNFFNLNNSIFFIVFILFLLPTFSQFGNGFVKLFTDFQNSKSLIIQSKDLKFRIEQGNYNQLNQVPQGDFQIASIDELGNPFVADIRDSSASWGKMQRTERYIKISNAIKNSEKCNRIKVDISGLNFNLPVIGKSYPVLLDANSDC
jgi:hypothetical protein